MSFWRHELGAIVVVALKNALKGSGLAYGSLRYFDESRVALPNAAGTGRLLPKAATAGEWIATGGHSPASPAYSDWQDTIETRKGKEE